MSGAAIYNTFFPHGPARGEASAPKSHPLRLFKFVLSIPTIVPLLVLMGWIFRIETAKSIAPGLVAMNPMIAIASPRLCLWIFRLAGSPAGKNGPPRSAIVFLGGARISLPSDRLASHHLFPPASAKPHRPQQR